MRLDLVHRIGRVRRAAPILAVSFVAIAAVVGAARAESDALQKPRMQMMLSEGDDGMIIAIFRRHPEETLPFIDEYLEGGLAMLEARGESAMPEAMQSFRTGVRFAKLADEAFGNDAFSKYANSFASWSPSEQKSFREGQRLYKEGRKLMKDDPAAALEPLKRSYELASSLGDSWGSAMAGLAFAEAAVQTEVEESVRLAVVTALNSRKNYDALQFGDDLVVRGFLAQGLAVAKWPESPREADAAGILNQAWGLARSSSTMNADLKRRVYEAFADYLDSTGRDSKTVRKDLDALNSTSATPPAAPAQDPS